VERFSREERIVALTNPPPACASSLRRVGFESPNARDDQRNRVDDRVGRQRLANGRFLPGLARVIPSIAQHDEHLRAPLPRER
jgi:hypothetical protein